MDNVSDNRSEITTFKSISSGNDIYDQIDRVYFQDFLNLSTNSNDDLTDSKDIIDYELKKLTFDKTEIIAKIKQLRAQSNLVGCRVSDIILLNSAAYSQELQRVSDFKLLLEDSNQICSIARRSLFMNESIFTMPTLQLIKKQERKSNLIHLLNSIKGIKHLKKTNLKIKELIENEEYPEAIENCFECEQSLVIFEHFKCIRDLKKHLKDHFYQIERFLDKNVAKVCYDYNEISYEKIVVSFKLLDKMESFTDQLNTHIISTLNWTASNTIIEILLKQSDFKAEELKYKEYNTLCSLLTNNNYKGCLIELCDNLWSIMKNYYRMFMWHETSTNTNDEIKKKFNQGLCRLWQDVQLKISICFRSMCFDHLKFDEFIEILTVNNRLIEIGQEYCNRSCDSQIMLKATKEQTLSFFKSYHVNHLEELKMFLENEIWHLCPVKSSFSLFKLHEFRFLKENKISTNSNILNTFLSNDITNKTPIKKLQSEPSFDLNNNIIEMLNNKKPFDLNANSKQNNKQMNENTIENNVSSDDSDDSDIDDDSDKENNSNNPDEIINNKEGYSTPSKRSLISILIARSKKNQTFKMPMLTNTTLNILRLYGKYIQMLSIFKIISTEVIAYLMQLFYFYFYYIYMHFAKDSNQSSNNYTSLEIIIKSIKNDLFVQSKYNMTEPVIASIRSMKNRQDYLDCINERIVAAESLVFLAQQLENIFPLLNEYLPCGSANNLEIYLNILKETPKIRQPIYNHISMVAIDYQQIGESISRINWDIEELMSQHSPYVDTLLRQVDQIIFDINSLNGMFVVERRILNIFLEQSIRHIMKSLVDGYGMVKKCSNEGRALMQLDFQQLIVKLEKICDIRPIPDKDYVEFYIKAYYLPDSSLEKWVKDHTEYSQKNIISLLNLMAQATRKTKLNIVASFAES